MLDNTKITKLNKLLETIETANRGRYRDNFIKELTLTNCRDFTARLNKALVDSGRPFSGVFYLDDFKGKVYLTYKPFKGGAKRLGVIIDNPAKPLGVGRFLNNLTYIVGAFKYYYKDNTNKDIFSDFTALKTIFNYCIDFNGLGRASILSLDDFKAVFSLAGLDGFKVVFLQGPEHNYCNLDYKDYFSALLQYSRRNDYWANISYNTLLNIYLTIKDTLNNPNNITPNDKDDLETALYLLECLRVSI